MDDLVGKAAKAGTTVDADGHIVKVGKAGMEKFEGIKEAAIQKGSYEGKSLELGGGGRFAMLVDELQVAGHSEARARAIAAKAGMAKYGKAGFTSLR